MTFDEFKDIVNNYVGTIEEGKNPFTGLPYIKFFNVNDLTSDGKETNFIRCEKVYCEICLRVYEHGIALTGYEKTYAIRGGFSEEATKSKLEYNLQRYNFIKKPFTQITLF